MRPGGRTDRVLAARPRAPPAPATSPRAPELRPPGLSGGGTCRLSGRVACGLAWAFGDAPAGFASLGFCGPPARDPSCETGHPQCGQAAALSDTCVPHSGHSISAIALALQERSLPVLPTPPRVDGKREGSADTKVFPGQRAYHGPGTRNRRLGGSRCRMGRRCADPWPLGEGRAGRAHAPDDAGMVQEPLRVARCAWRDREGLEGETE